jgi:mannose-6-phosphate isomerase
VPTTPSVHRLEPAVRDYAWGSRTVLAELRGADAPTAGPEAEAWFGAHPGAPAGLAGRGDLCDLLAADPERQLGATVAERFGGRLPFLVKLLAAAEPLSLQVHPDASQAAAGYAAEEACGIARDAPTRVYRDGWPKPELLLALTPFSALCGFRELPRTITLLDRLAVPQLTWIRDALASAGERALPDIIARALRPRDELADELAALRPAVDRLAGRDADLAAEAGWLALLLERYPRDGGVLVAALLRLVELTPGQAVHLPAGNPHAYLRGAGVEVMASSDNVVRGGLTAKHVDVEELLRVIDPRVLPPPLVTPEVRDGWTCLPTPSPQFAVSHRTLTADPVRVDRRIGGPEILLVLGGTVTVTADDDVVTIGSAGGAYVAAATRELAVAGSGTVYRTTLGG